MCDPMGTVPDGCEVSRRGLSPLDQLPASRCAIGYRPYWLRQMPVVSTQKQFAADTQLPEPMGTASDGSEETRTGLSPLDRLPASPLGTSPVGSDRCQ